MLWAICVNQLTGFYMSETFHLIMLRKIFCPDTVYWHKKGTKMFSRHFTIPHKWATTKGLRVAWKNSNSYSNSKTSWQSKNKQTCSFAGGLFQYVWPFLTTRHWILNSNLYHTKIHKRHNRQIRNQNPVKRYLVVNYFCKMLYLRSLIGFWISLWKDIRRISRLFWSTIFAKMDLPVIFIEINYFNLLFSFFTTLKQQKSKKFSDVCLGFKREHCFKLC